jgi:hypothetical protein
MSLSTDIGGLSINLSHFVQDGQLWLSQAHTEVVFATLAELAQRADEIEAVATAAPVAALSGGRKNVF